MDGLPLCTCCHVNGDLVLRAADLTSGPEVRTSAKRCGRVSLWSLIEQIRSVLTHRCRLRGTWRKRTLSVSGGRQGWWWLSEEEVAAPKPLLVTSSIRFKPQRSHYHHWPLGNSFFHTPTPLLVWLVVPWFTELSKGEYAPVEPPPYHYHYSYPLPHKHTHISGLDDLYLQDWPPPAQHAVRGRSLHLVLRPAASEVLIWWPVQRPDLLGQRGGLWLSTTFIASSLYPPLPSGITSHSLDELHSHSSFSVSFLSLLFGFSLMLETPTMTAVPGPGSWPEE